MNVIDVNIFNVWTRDVQSCVVSALAVYSIVYILLCFLLLTVILKAYELRSFQSSDRHGSPKILAWNRDSSFNFQVSHRDGETNSFLLG